MNWLSCFVHQGKGRGRAENAPLSTSGTKGCGHSLSPQYLENSWFWKPKTFPANMSHGGAPGLGPGLRPCAASAARFLWRPGTLRGALETHWANLALILATGGPKLCDRDSLGCGAGAGTLRGGGGLAAAAPGLSGSQQQVCRPGTRPEPPSWVPPKPSGIRWP